ncbi:MAG: hypothetical protein H6948_14850 [Zoogloeaceae bacterium]|nr:hypothetical protein [Zoogloeaceae bacterium]
MTRTSQHGLFRPEEFAAMKEFVASPVQHTFASLRVGRATQIESWEAPAQVAMADLLLSGSPRNILELGYGAGIASDRLVRHGEYDSYMCIEVHPLIASVASSALSQAWNASTVQGAWQVVVPALRREYFDGILNDAYLPFDDIGADHVYSPSDLATYITKSASSLEPLLSRGGIVVQLDITGSIRLDEDSLKRIGFSEIQYIRLKVAIPQQCQYARGEFVNIVVIRK